jgi:hypothetical protein
MLDVGSGWPREAWGRASRRAAAEERSGWRPLMTAAARSVLLVVEG